MTIRLFPLRLISEKPTLNFMRLEKWYLGLSIITMILSLGILMIKGLHFGIDFSGGLLLEVQITPAPELSTLRDKLIALNLGDISLQQLEDPRQVMIRVGSASESQNTVLEPIKSLLNQLYGTQIEYRKIDFVGPQVGGELIRAGSLAFMLAFIAIAIYVWIRFDWQYSIGALLALLHDAVVTLGFLSITQLEFNLTTIAAILTIIGYSINDSVVIYDRIRENLRKYKKVPLYTLINNSLNETLSRTILTVATTLLATIALVVFGGDVLKSFSITMLFGIVIGTYSSIYISAPLLIHFNLRKNTP